MVGVQEYSRFFSFFLAAQIMMMFMMMITRLEHIQLERIADTLLCLAFPKSKKGRIAEIREGQ